MRRTLSVSLLPVLLSCSAGSARLNQVTDGGLLPGVDGPIGGSADADNDGLSDAEERRLGSDPNNPDSDGDGRLDGDEVIVGTDPTRADEPCVREQTRAASVSKPVDIILVIDTSSSMDGEIDAVERNININFAQIIGASQIDYRIVLLAKYHPPPSGKNSICVGQPLAGHSCAPLPAQPTNGERFFHYSVYVGSEDSFERILQTFDGRQPDQFDFAPQGWSQWLRPEAFKVFLEITDDSSAMSADDFEEALFALSPQHFGGAEDRNYIWHSILGMKANDPPETPWPSTAPLQGRCSPGSDGSGRDYQRVSRRTGGLRFPLCNNDNFDVIFRRIAQGVVEGSRLPCQYALPESAPGRTINPERAVLVYTPGDGGAPQSLRPVSDAASCRPGAFYLNGGALQICPQSCSAIEADTAGTLEVHLGCRFELE